MAVSTPLRSELVGVQGITKHARPKGVLKGDTSVHLTDANPELLCNLIYLEEEER